jgi:hypothetical protein
MRRREELRDVEHTACSKCGLRWPNHAVGCVTGASRDAGAGAAPSPDLAARRSQELVPVTWREWDRIVHLACERLGVTLTELGETRVVDVLLALRDATPEGVDERAPSTCRGCGGLALEVDAWGRCRLCVRDQRAARGT